MSELADARQFAIRFAIERVKNELRLFSDIDDPFSLLVYEEVRRRTGHPLTIRAVLCDGSGGEAVGSNQKNSEPESLALAGWQVRVVDAKSRSRFLIIDDAQVVFDEFIYPEGAPWPTLLSLYSRDSVRACSDDFDRIWSNTSQLLYEDYFQMARGRSVASIAEVTWSNLIRYLASHPEALSDLPSRKFEELVAELLARDGFEVMLTPKSNDGGRDILAFSQSRAGRHLFYVECKRYKKQPVGVEIVRALYGTVVKNRATAGVVVTTSRFTRNALALAREIEFQMALKDRDALLAWINAVNVVAG